MARRPACITPSRWAHARRAKSGVFERTPGALGAGPRVVPEAAEKRQNRAPPLVVVGPFGVGLEHLVNEFAVANAQQSEATSLLGRSETRIWVRPRCNVSAKLRR